MERTGRMAKIAIKKGNDDISRLEIARSIWEMTTYDEKGQSIYDGLRPWELPPDNDPVSGSIEDIYRIKYLDNNINEMLGISFVDWIKQPMYMCDRDISACLAADKRKSERLEAARRAGENNPHSEDIMGDLTK